MKGIINWRVPEKGYGFVTGDDGNSYFLHISDIAGCDGTYPEVGQKVKFMVRETWKGKAAVNAVIDGKVGEDYECE